MAANSLQMQPGQNDGCRARCDVARGAGHSGDADRATQAVRRIHLNPA
jgi:hypothetical protein